ncbi:MAG TPA: hypothetical protein VK202_02205 [Bacteroidia bacterium]|nr:hypothetical protein [Bacteroidia bacterium]
MEHINDIKPFDRIGSLTTLLICLPIGLLFSFLVLTISLFPPFNIALTLGGGGLFWFPGSIIIPLTFAYLVWTGGRKIVNNLRQDKSVLRTSFLFSIYVNTFLFLTIAMLWLIGGLFYTIDLKEYSKSTFVFIGLGLTIVTYIIATITTTFTIGLLTVFIIKKRLKRR